MVHPVPSGHPALDAGGGQRHLEQSFQLQGVSAALSVLGILAVLALILPNFTVSAEGPVYSKAGMMVWPMASAHCRKETYDNYPAARALLQASMRGCKSLSISD